MSVVTRFPPSPTGFMHIGNARTALFNWLYSRRLGGKFLVRIEDTDRKRHSEEAVKTIIKGLEWLELDWDGDIVSQFARQKHHTNIAKAMVENGKAYYCYCSPEELETMREDARAQGKSSVYDRRWRERNPTEAPKNVKPVIRIKAPLDGATTIHDQVQGKVTVQNKELDDFIIVRSDGTPTYMLSVVVDDHDMGITHIIRGDDHLNNAFRQTVIFDAMGWKIPEFAHLPLIHGPDGKKFSKRHGAQSVEEYQQMGYLPEAMRNYLLRLGWGHGNEEIIPTNKALELFDLGGIGKSASNFDFSKLESLNAHYISAGKPDDILRHAEPFFQSRHNTSLNEVTRKRILAHSEELQSRAKTLHQYVDESVFYAKNLPLSYNEKARAQLDDSGKNILKTLNESLGAIKESDLTESAVQEICKIIAENETNGKLGKIAMPLRAALTGTTVSPSIFKAVEILGKEESCTRIQAAIKG